VPHLKESRSATFEIPCGVVLQVRAYQAAVRATQAMGVTVVRYTAILNAEVRPSLKPTYISALGVFFGTGLGSASRFRIGYFWLV
jgi:hypothetical protein